MRYHANDHPLGAGLNTRNQDIGFAGNARGNTIDHERSPHSDRVLSFMVAMPRDQQHGLQRTGFGGARSGLPQQQFDHMWGIGSPNQEHDLFGVEALPVDAIIMVGGRPLRPDQRAELDDLGGPSYSTPLSHVGSIDRRAPAMTVREMLEIVRQVSTHSVHETASLEAYEAALLDLMASASGIDHAHWYFTDWHRYPPHFQYYIGTSCHGATPRSGFRYIRRTSDIQYPDGHLRADGGVAAGRLVVHPRLATALAIAPVVPPQATPWTTFINAMLDNPMGINIGADVRDAYVHVSAFPSVMRLLREQALVAGAFGEARFTVITSGMQYTFDDGLRQQGGRAGRDGWRTAMRALQADYMRTPILHGGDHRSRIVTDVGHDTFLRSSSLRDHGLVREVLTEMPSIIGSSTMMESHVRRTTEALRSIYNDRPRQQTRSSETADSTAGVPTPNTYEGLLHQVITDTTPHQQLGRPGRVNDDGRVYFLIRPENLRRMDTGDSDAETVASASDRTFSRRSLRETDLDDDVNDPLWRARQQRNNALALEPPSQDARTYRLGRVGLRRGDEDSLIGDGPTDDEVDSDELEELLPDSGDSSASSESSDPRQEFVDELRRMWFEHGRAQPRPQLPNLHALRDLDEHFMQDWRELFDPNFITHFPVLVDDSMLDDERMTRQCNARALNARQWETLRHMEQWNERFPDDHMQQYHAEEFDHWVRRMDYGRRGYPWPHPVETMPHLRLDAGFTRWLADQTSIIRKLIWPTTFMPPGSINLPYEGAGGLTGALWFRQDQLSVFVPLRAQVICRSCGSRACIYRNLYVMYHDNAHRRYMCFMCCSLDVVHIGELGLEDFDWYLQTPNVDDHMRSEDQLRFVPDIAERVDEAAVRQYHRSLIVHTSRYDGWDDSMSDDDSVCSLTEAPDTNISDYVTHEARALDAVDRVRDYDPWHYDDPVLRAERRGQQFTFRQLVHQRQLKRDVLAVQIRLVLLIKWRSSDHRQETFMLHHMVNAIDSLRERRGAFIQLLIPFITPLIQGFFRCRSCMSINGPHLPVVHHDWCPLRNTFDRGLPRILQCDDLGSQWYGVGRTDSRRIILERNMTFRPRDPDDPILQMERRSLLNSVITFPCPDIEFNVHDRRIPAALTADFPTLAGAGASIIVSDEMSMAPAGRYNAHVFRHPHPGAGERTPDDEAPRAWYVRTPEVGHGMAPPSSSSDMDVSEDSSELTQFTPHQIDDPEFGEHWWYGLPHVDHEREDAIRLFEKYPESLHLAYGIRINEHGEGEIDDKLILADLKVRCGGDFDFHEHHLHWTIWPNIPRYSRLATKLREDLIRFAHTLPTPLREVQLTEESQMYRWEFEFRKQAFGMGILGFGDFGLPHTFFDHVQDPDDPREFPTFWTRYFRLTMARRRMFLEQHFAVHQPRGHHRIGGGKMPPYPGYPAQLRARDFSGIRMPVDWQKRIHNSRSLTPPPLISSVTRRAEYPLQRWKDPNVQFYLSWVARMESAVRMLLFYYNRMRRSYCRVYGRLGPQRDWPWIWLPPMEVPLAIGKTTSINLEAMAPRSHFWPDDFSHSDHPPHGHQHPWFTHAPMHDFWKSVRLQENKPRRPDINIVTKCDESAETDGYLMPFRRIAGHGHFYYCNPHRLGATEQRKTGLTDHDNVHGYHHMDLALPEYAFNDCNADILQRPARFPRNALRWPSTDEHIALTRPPDYSLFRILPDIIRAHNLRPVMTYPIRMPGIGKSMRKLYRSTIRALRIALGLRDYLPCPRRPRDAEGNHVRTPAFISGEETRPWWRQKIVEVMRSRQPFFSELDWASRLKWDSRRRTTIIRTVRGPTERGATPSTISPGSQLYVDHHNREQLQTDLELGLAPPLEHATPEQSMISGSRPTPGFGAYRQQRLRAMVDPNGREPRELSPDIAPPDNSDHTRRWMDILPHNCVICRRPMNEYRSWLICLQCDPQPPDFYARHDVLYVHEPHVRMPSQWAYAPVISRTNGGAEGVGRGGWFLGGNGHGQGCDVGKLSREIPDHVVHNAEAVVLWDGSILRPGDVVPS